MNDSLLSRIVNRGKPSPVTEHVDDCDIPVPVPAPSMPPFVAVLLKQFGITPESINTYAEGLRDAIVKQLQEINSKLATIENKCNELESNQRVLLDAATKDAEHDGFLAQLDRLHVSPTIDNYRNGELPPCPVCGSALCTTHIVEINERKSN